MENILIIDDSKTVCLSLEMLIKNELGYTPVIGHSKQECIELLKEYKDNISVALLDLDLPDAPNGEVVDVVTKFGIPSIVLTGSTDKEELFRDKTIVDYVIKEGAFTFEYIKLLVHRIVENKGLKVLVVDDNTISSEKTIELLKRYQLQYIKAHNGQEALELLKKNKDIKMVFTNYMLPKMDGLQLTKRIRSIYTKDQVAIVTIAGQRDNKIVAKFLKYGANDYLYKGFSDEEFYARLNAHLETLELFEDIKNKANKDYLTGMYNRRYFFDEGEKLFSKAIKQDIDIAIAMFDIDKFKNVNDTYGHDIGDIAIKEVANVVEKYFDNEAIIARFGGEEFCVIQLDQTEQEFVDILEIIRGEFEINVIHTLKGDLQYTVSIGYCVTPMETLEDMVNQSDAGLYIAKESGRNQVRKKD